VAAEGQLEEQGPEVTTPEDANLASDIGRVAGTGALHGVVPPEFVALPHVDRTREFTDTNGHRWTVRVRVQGDRWGAEHRLVHEQAEPVVEFYDAHIQGAHWTEQTGGYHWGQFVASYRIDAIIGVFLDGRGINLQGGVPTWTVSDTLVGDVLRWVRSYDPTRSPS
jgi:hypothetical protein